MTVEQLRSTLQARPFRPFTIRMGDGRSFLINHPEFMSQSPLGRTIIVYGADENFSILDLMLATELEIHRPSQASGGAAA